LDGKAGAHILYIIPEKAGRLPSLNIFPMIPEMVPSLILMGVGL
jgi:hypothetical protein